MGKFKTIAALGAAAAMASGLFAEEAKTEAQPAVPTSVQAAKPVPAPRRQFDRAKFQERMKKMQAERKEKMTEVLKKYGLDDAKASECADELMKLAGPRGPMGPRAAHGQRPPRPAAGPRPAPTAAPAPAAAPASAEK